MSERTSTPGNGPRARGEASAPAASPASPADHGITIDSTLLGFVAVCLCGWRSEPTPARPKAAVEGHFHTELERPIGYVLPSARFEQMLKQAARDHGRDQAPQFIDEGDVVRITRPAWCTDAWWSEFRVAADVLWSSIVAAESKAAGR